MGGARSERQSRAHIWCGKLFGWVCAKNVRERALSALTHTLALAQCAGVQREDVEAIAVHVYTRRPGSPVTEFGHVGVSLLCLARAMHIDADGAEESRLDALEHLSDAEAQAVRGEHERWHVLGLTRETPTQSGSPVCPSAEPTSAGDGEVF